VIMTVAMAVAAGAAFGKLPAPPAPDPAKAAADAKKKADAAKRDKDMLGKAQDRAVAAYRRNKGIKK